MFKLILEFPSFKRKATKSKHADYIVLLSMHYMKSTKCVHVENQQNMARIKLNAFLSLSFFLSLSGDLPWKTCFFQPAGSTKTNTQWKIKPMLKASYRIAIGEQQALSIQILNMANEHV